LSNLLTMAQSLKGAKRMSSCPAGAPAFLLLVSQGVSTMLSTSLRAATGSPLMVWVLSQLLSQFLMKSDNWASVAIWAGVLEASWRIRVPKVQGPLTVPFWVQEFQVRAGSSTTPRLVIMIQFFLT